MKFFILATCLAMAAAMPQRRQDAPAAPPMPTSPPAMDTTMDAPAAVVWLNATAAPGSNVTVNIPVIVVDPVVVVVDPVTTDAPGVATDAPVVATAAPVVATAAPVVATDAPVVATDAPTTVDAVVVTDAPTTDAPTTTPKPTTPAPTMSTTVGTTKIVSVQEIVSIFEQVAASDFFKRMTYADQLITMEIISGGESGKIIEIFRNIGWQGVTDFMHDIPLKYVDDFWAFIDQGYAREHHRLGEDDLIQA